MRTGWISDSVMGHLLAALTPPNRLACEMSLRYGMRIGDVLALKSEQLMKPKLCYREQKTGKRRVVNVSAKFRGILLSQAGRVYVFEHRTTHLDHEPDKQFGKTSNGSLEYFVSETSVCTHAARATPSANTVSAEIWRKSNGF